MAKQLSKYAHPKYVEALPDYIKIRDCYKGERAIKEAGEQYLPRLGAQSQGDYDNYRRRALFFPITGKTTSSMVGLATAKPPKIEYPDTMSRYFVDSEQGYQFTEFYVSIFSETILMGRYGVLIDAPADREGEELLCPYIAENIINWKIDRDTSKLTMLLLKEHYEEAGEDEFETKSECRYRKCFIDTDGVYRQQLYDDDLKPEGPVLTPTFSGFTIDFIPYIPFGASGVHMDVDKPPMLDISTINISHYLTSADLEWGRHIVGLPTPVVSGVDSGTTFKIGGTSAWVLPVPEARAYYLEFLGQGLQSLEKAMTDKVGLMASISARLVDNSTRGSEAAETVRLRYMNEAASLIHIIGAVNTGVNLLYNMLAKVRRESQTVAIHFNKDVLGANIAFKDLKVLFEAYLEGHTSKETLVYNLRRLDALDPNRTDEQELAAIGPPRPTQTKTDPAGNNAQ